MKVEIEESKWILITGLQLIIIILMIWDYFRTRKTKKFLTSEIKRLDNKIKTFGCVRE